MLDLARLSLLILAGCGDDGSPADAAPPDAIDSGTTDGGSSCRPIDAVRVSDGAAGADFPAIAASDDGYGVTWIDQRHGNPEVYFARLDGNGAQVGSDVRVTDSPGDAVLPVLAWSGTGYGLAWTDDRSGTGPGIYFARLDASGARMGDERLAIPRGAAAALVWSGSEYLVAAYADPPAGGSFDIRAARIGADGTVVASDLQLTSSGSAFNPALAATGAGYGLAFHDARGGDAQIFFARLDAAGTVQGMARQLSTEQGGSAALLFTGSEYALAWRSGTMMDASMAFIRLDAMGSPIGMPAIVGMRASRPSIAAGDDGFAIAWTDGADHRLALLSATGAPEDEVVVSPTALGTFIGNAVVHRDGAIALVWLDARDGIGEVYFGTRCL